MKVFFCPEKSLVLSFFKTRFLCLLSLLVSLGLPAIVRSQTTPLTFTPVPYSDPDIISPGRGAEQWQNGSESINNPVPDSNHKPLDVYYRLPWTQFEDSIGGKYKWTFFDNIIKEAIDNSQKLSFGIMPVYNEEGTVFYDSAISAYPLYLHKAMQAGEENTRDWISNGVWIPNWNHSYYLARLRALHIALNSHILTSTYKGVAFKNAIYCIDIRGYGNFGEWHHAGIVDHISEYPTGRRATAATLKAIIGHHTQVFTQWPLTLMIAAFDAGQYDAIMTPVEVTYYALTTRNTWGPLGWRRDQWGATDIYLDKILKDNEKKYGTSPPFKQWITTRFLTSPVTGEPPRYVNEGGTCEYWDLESQLVDYGATSLGNGNWGVPMSQCGIENARAAFKRAGYRIILEGGNVSKLASPGKPFSITLQWKNIGIAPTYENWNVIFELKNDNNTTIWSGTSKFKPKRFAPSNAASSISDTFLLSGNIAVGKYKLNLIIKDPVGYRMPLPLAITGRNPDGSYTISDFNVSPTICTPPIATISNSPPCNGQAFDLVLDSASGKAPYDLVINGTTYQDIMPGQIITSTTQPLQNIWNTIPSAKSTEDSPVELGVKFSSSIAGSIKGIRFFSSDSPFGIYTGHLWTGSGTLLESAVFTNVTPNSWQEVLFTNPVQIKPDTTYIVSYHTAGGRYAATPAGLKNSVTNGFLTVPADSIHAGNGIYKYGASGGFPSNSYNATNYWVDVIFAPNTHTFNLTSVIDSMGCNNIGSLQALNVNFTNNCDSVPIENSPTATIKNSSACGTGSFNLVLDSASGSGPYDLVINGVAYHNIAPGQTITTITPQSQKIWSSVPSPLSSQDMPVELGVKFKTSVAGSIKGIRFFSPAAPSGTYTGHLWTNTGTLLGSALFTNVTTNGWQEVLFTNPVLIDAATTYIASYHTAGGHYAATPAGLKNNVTSGYLTVPGDSVAGGNGVYKYGASGSFPSMSFNANNYWVDVIFTADTTYSYTFNLTSITDSKGSTKTGALQTLSVTTTSNCDSIPVDNSPTASIINSSACGAQSFNLVLDSARGTGPYDLVINGVVYHDIQPGQTITTIAPPSQKIWNSVPSPLSSQDMPVELGVKFKASVAGSIKGIRFFSPTIPSGTYTGHLWSSSGTLISSAVFTNVTANGWQEVLFANPVLIDAGTTYIASYHTAGGHYAATPAGLKNTVASGFLTVPGDSVAHGNGVYKYGASGSFPSMSYNANNYWVDVIFTADTTYSYTFDLTSITDGTGSTKTGALQTLSVTSTECSQSRPATNVPGAEKNNSSQVKPPVPGSVKSEEKNLYRLGQNYPNPFSNKTTIQYSVPKPVKVKLSLYDINGKLVKVLVDGLKEPGTYTINLNKALMSGGVYFYRIQTREFSAVKKLIIQ